MKAIVDGARSPSARIRAAIAARARELVYCARTGFEPPAGSEPPLRDDDLAAFCEHNTRALGRNIRWVTGIMMVFNLIFWFSDSWAFEALPWALPLLARSRLLLTGVGLLALLAQQLLPHRPVLVGAFAVMTTCCIVGYTLGALGPPSSPWFHFLYPFLFFLLIEWATPLERVAHTLGVALAASAGYFLPHPGHLHDPLARVAMAHLSYVVALSTVSGVYTDRLRRQGFFLRRSAERASSELERRVVERTAEVRSLLQRLERAREQERRRIARELHDELGQQLTAMRCVLKVARVRAERESSPLGPNLEELAGLLAQSTETTRVLLDDLRPRVLDDLGLDAAAAWLVQQTAQTSKMKCTLTTSGDLGDLPPDLAVAAFRVLQEALTNAVRHAGGSRVAVTLQREHDRLEMSMEDDGGGFDPGLRGRGSAGTGLVGMRERAVDLGGSLVVDSSPGRGTRVSLVLPLAGAGGVS